MTAFEELESILKEKGLADNEISFLLGRFLEEEAFQYVECMNLVLEHLKENATA